MNKSILLLVIAMAFLASCNPYRKVTYVQGAGTPVDYSADTATYGIPDVVIKKGDLLTIVINNPKSAQSTVPFNLPWMPSGGSDYQANVSTLSAGSMQNYLVDTQGDILFPYLGKIHVAGKTKTGLTSHLISELYPLHLQEEPVITIRFSNFKITIIGSAGRSAVLTVNNEKISIFEALASAGDLSLHARRDKVLLIRETGDERVSHRLDLRDPKLLNSSYFWLQQNDILYIEPDRPLANSTYFGVMENFAITLIGTAMSTTSFVLTLVTFLKNQ
jgi:polysaccharide export outer membrane protein